MRGQVSYGQRATGGPDRGVCFDAGQCGLTPAQLHRGNRVFLIGEAPQRNVPTEMSCNAARIRKTEFGFSRERWRLLHGVGWTDWPAICSDSGADRVSEWNF
jgi:hypothetical protein